MLLWFGKRPSCRVDEPRGDDGKHIELLARVGGEERAGDKVVPGGVQQRVFESLSQAYTCLSLLNKMEVSDRHCTVIVLLC